jgi:hypothetical protein
VKPVKMTSESVNEMIEQLLLTGAASTASRAEEMFLDQHLPELAELILELDDDSFQRHEAIKLLMSHGSRRREDALP